MFFYSIRIIKLLVSVSTADIPVLHSTEVVHFYHEP
jgi:hypothetical protein